MEMAVRAISGGVAGSYWPPQFLPGHLPSTAAIFLPVSFGSNFSRKIGPIESPQKLWKYTEDVFWPCEAIPGLRFPRKIRFWAFFCCETLQYLVVPDTTTPSGDGKIWGQNIDLHQKLNRVDLSSASRRIRQCKNISPTPIQWPGFRVLVPKWHVLTWLRAAIMG